MVFHCRSIHDNSVYCSLRYSKIGGGGGGSIGRLIEELLDCILRFDWSEMSLFRFVLFLPLVDRVLNDLGEKYTGFVILSKSQ